jgi:predicted nucleic acid-binding protein
VTYLLDSSVIIDALNDRKGRRELLAKLSEQEILLACCAVSVTELYMGIRPTEEARTQQFLRSLEFFPVTWEVAKLAGDLFRQWRQKGQTLGLADVTIAAVALTHGLPLLTDNVKHFPMSNLELVPVADAV